MNRAPRLLVVPAILITVACLAALLLVAPRRDGGNGFTVGPVMTGLTLDTGTFILNTSTGEIQQISETGYGAAGWSPGDGALRLGQVQGVRGAVVRHEADAWRVEEVDAPTSVWSVSPDGRYRLIYEESARSPRQGLVEVVNTGERFALMGINLTTPAWSPDVAVSNDDYPDPEAEIAIYDLAERHFTSSRIEIAASWDGIIAWSPDGKYLAATDDRFFELEFPTSRPRVAIARPDGGRVEQLADGRVQGWSADGQAVLYLKDGDLYQVDIVSRRRDLLLATDVETLLNAVPSPDGRYIALSSYGYADELFEVNVSTLRERKVGVGANARWSPDGRRVAFQSYFARGSSTYTMNADGSNVVRHGGFRFTDLGIGCTGFEAHYSWSPDGEKIAVWDGDEWNNRIVISSASGGGSGEVAQSVGIPSFSPDGRFLAYSTPGFQVCDLVLYGTANGAKKTLVSQRGFRYDWSPDGRFIVMDTGIDLGYTAPSEDPLRIVEVETDSSRWIGGGHDPHWSPAGDRIAYVSNGQLVIEDVDGSRPLIRLTLPGSTLHLEGIRNFVWSPDGRQIAFDIYTRGEAETWVVAVDAPESMRSLGPGSVCDWSPQGETVLISRSVPGFRAILP